jgi:hypothetical protein
MCHGLASSLLTLRKPARMPSVPIRLLRFAQIISLGFVLPFIVQPA